MSIQLPRQSLASSKHKYFGYLAGLTFYLLSACSSSPQFVDSSTISLLPVKNQSATLSIRNWSDTYSLTLMNGGPYTDNSIDFQIGTRFVETTDRYVVAIDMANNLRVIDFKIKPAKQILSMPLDDDATSLTSDKNRILVGLKNSGLLEFTLNDQASSVEKRKLSDARLVTRVKLHNDSIYFLSNNDQITRITKDDKSEQSWRLPGTSHDFAIVEEGFVLLGTDYGLGIVNKASPSKLLSSFSLQGSKQQLQVFRQMAVVADGDGGTVLFDIQDSSNIRWLGSHNKLGSIEKLIFDNDQLYVVDRGIRLSSINIKRPELPITGSFYRPAATITDIAPGKNAGTVYIATSEGIERIIFPEDSHGQVSNEGINQGGTRRAYITDNIAYVADWFSGLHLYDISNPAKPEHLSNVHTPGSSKGVVVENGYAYVGDDDHGLQIIDVHDPENPVTVGSVLTTGLAYTLKKRGELVFLADHRGGFHIINVADVTKPFIVSSHNTKGKSWAIDVKGDVAYVADDNSGLLVFDVSDIANPRQIGQFDPQGYAEDVVVRNNIAYVSFFDKGLYLLDVSDPAQPQLISQLDIPGNARSIVLKENLAFVAGWESGLQIINITDIRAPKIIGAYDTTGSAWGADINGNHVYVWDWWGGVKVINVADPDKPVLESQYHANSKINRLREKNNFIYTANHTAGVQVFDANNVLNPIWSTGIDIPGKVLDVWPTENENYLFAVSDEAGLVVLDISDPFYIKQVANYPVSGSPYLVREHNSKVYVATESGELIVFKTKGYPVLEKSQTLRMDVNDLWVGENTVLVASSQHGLIAFATDKQGKISPHQQQMSETSRRIGGNENYIASSSDDGEITVWSKQNESIQYLTSIQINEPVLELTFQNSSLLVLTENRGLLQYKLTGQHSPQLVARYPLTDNYSDLLHHDNAVFFAGQDTIASVQLLPEIQWSPADPGKIKISFSSELPVGNYHLAISDNKGAETIWPNALSVKIRKSGKPKLSIEDFQKLLEQHRKKTPLK